ncbi:MAG: aldo/keto reductase [Euryarchaeota archaeon]|nr:aldo/keto reductase [Euryarchaeota archaeon]
MDARAFGPTGIDVPVIGQGTWQLKNAKRAEQALKAGLDLGMTHIDTAELYRGSEEVVARAIQNRRDDVFLVSKVLPRNATREGVVAACEASLKRLGTDHLDVYLLHWREDTLDLRGAMHGLEEVAKRGWTRHIGVSNFDVADLEEATKHLSSRPIACNQVLYHVADRGIENGVIPYCERNDIAVVAYAPFGGDYVPWPPGGVKGLRVLEDIGKRHGKTARQVALNFLTRNESVFTIPKAEKVEHARENAGGVGWVLTNDDLREIEAAFPRPPPGPLPMF